MSALPTRLKPFWPVFKRVHRALALCLGFLFRRLAPLAVRRAVPRSGSTSSDETARREPQSVTVHHGGPAEDVVRRPAPGRPADHWRFRQAEQARIPQRYTLEIAGGRLVGEFGAAVTPGGRLDYQTSGYFGLSSWREHPLFLRPLMGRVERVPGTVLSLTTRGTASNYYHFLYDAVARYGIVEECLPGRALDAVVVPHRSGYQRALLELAGIPGPFVEPAPGVCIEAGTLLVPSTPNQDLDAPPWVVNWLRDRLRPSGRRDLPRRLYVTRGDRPNTRRYVQEAQLRPWLERHGFVVVDPGSHPVQEQIDMFHAAEVVVGPHGAGLTNITFCSPGARVLEMFAATYVHLGLWTIADAVDGVSYRYLVADGDHRPGRRMQGNYDDVSIPVEIVQEAVRDMLD